MFFQSKMIYFVLVFYILNIKLISRADHLVSGKHLRIAKCYDSEKFDDANMMKLNGSCRIPMNYSKLKYLSALDSFFLNIRCWSNQFFKFLELKRPQNGGKGKKEVNTFSVYNLIALIPIKMKLQNKRSDQFCLSWETLQIFFQF